MKTIFVIHTHWFNRGDEAANRAFFDEVMRLDNSVNIILQINNTDLTEIDKLKDQGIVVLDNRFPKSEDLLEYIFIYISKGKITFSEAGKSFVESMQKADIIVHAPGGPSIGDIYKEAERPYLLRLLLAKRMKKTYMFYAPSMGPFNNKIRNCFRKKVLLNAKKITFREDISADYFHEFLPDMDYEVTLDSAFQNDIDFKENEIIFNKNTELRDFLKSYDKVIGITITDLQWNPLHKNNEKIKLVIKDVFTNFISFLDSKNYGVIFIPQLFGKGNDYNYMNTFSGVNTYILEDIYDCYFQQYLISKLFAVVGMRYHSNIFSCKMCVPFLSISYEQKMRGFMEKQGLIQYCIDINDLSIEMLLSKFETLVSNYDVYKNKLWEKEDELKQASQRTTQILLNELEAIK